MPPASVHEHKLVREHECLGELLPGGEVGNGEGGEIFFGIPKLGDSGFNGSLGGKCRAEFWCPEELVAVQPVSDINDEVEAVTRPENKASETEIGFGGVQSGIPKPAQAGVAEEAADAISGFRFVDECGGEIVMPGGGRDPAADDGMTACVSWVAAYGSQLRPAEFLVRPGGGTLPCAPGDAIAPAQRFRTRPRRTAR